MNCIACGQRAVQLHHAVYAQQVKRSGGDLRDERNLVPTCLRCHERHHTYTSALELRELPDGVFEFATELMGPGPAYEYLRRHYVGPDWRLDALLADWEAAR